jgi:hypothetical protein
MPLYYFHVYNDEVTIDDEGADLADEAAAHCRAIKEARALAAHSVLQGHLTRSHRLEIADEKRTVLAVLRFDQAVEIRD